MNRLLRPFGLKLGPLQAGAVYFPLHFFAVGIGLTLLISPQGVGVFWPATGSLFAFLLLYPARYWLALLALSFAAELAAHELFAPQIPYSVAGLLFFVKFAAAVLRRRGWCTRAYAARSPSRGCDHVLVLRGSRRWCRHCICAFVAVTLRGDAGSSGLANSGSPCRAGGSATSSARS